MNYKRRLFLYFLFVFTVFTIAVICYEQWREKGYRAEVLSSTLNAYSYSVENDTTAAIALTDMRVTHISEDGTVIFDNDFTDEAKMENHLHRPEIERAFNSGEGYDIRLSATTGREYFYFARKTDSGFIRVALPYQGSTRSLLNPDRNFIIFIVLLFVVAMIFLWAIARRFGRDLEDLKLNLTKEVRARAKLKAEITSAISHELRTPTSAIRSYSETLCEEGIDEKYREQFIRRIHTASIRLSELLENVSLLTKIEEAPDKFYKDDLNVSLVAREVLDEFSYLAEKNMMTLESNMPDDITIRGSKTLIYSVWRNLMENAIKYGGKGVHITLSYDGETSTHYLFSVTDNGEGIDAKYLPRLFERFYRVQSGRTREAGGSGLGLSIVAHAIKFHRGDVHASKSADGGLKISFSLLKKDISL